MIVAAVLMQRVEDPGEPLRAMQPISGDETQVHFS
jgi:hypothetical protein